jgi:WD40 repeat protein
MKIENKTRKAVAPEARTAWERLSQKQCNSVVGKTFWTIIENLNEAGEAPLLSILDILFDSQEPIAAHTSLKTQFINRPFVDVDGKHLLKLCASRVSLKNAKTKDAKTKDAVNSAYANAFVWFEISDLLDPSSPELAVVPNADVSKLFTEPQAIDLTGKQSVEAAKSAAKSAALVLGETAQALNEPKKSIQNYGQLGSRHGSRPEEFQSGVLAQDERLGRGQSEKFLKGRTTVDSIRDEKLERKSQSVPALATLLQWAQNTTKQAPRLYALLGDAGAGKTSLAQQFVRILNGEVTHPEWLNVSGSIHAPVALFIDLSDLSGVENLAQLSLEEMLVLTLKRRDGALIQTVENVAPFVARARAGSLIFVFDGLDELLKNDAAVLQKVFEQFIKVVERRPSTSANSIPPKVIVSCRSHYFRDVETQHSFFTARGRGNVANDDYRCLTLLPWGSELIESYLARRLGQTEAAKLMRLIATTYNLEELASKPVLLSMMAGNLQELLRAREAGQDILASTLYSQTVASWISRDDGKHRINPAHKPLLMGALAAALWNDEAESWAADRLDQWLVRTIQTLFPGHYDASSMQSVQNDLRTATFIVRPDNQQFNFAHKSYSEYFLARFMIDGLSQVADGFWTLDQLRMHLPIFLLNVESQNFLKEMWATDNSHQSERTQNQRADVLVQLLQEQSSLNDDNANSQPAAAPNLHAVLWQMLLAIKRPIIADKNKPINLRGLTFSGQRWEDLEASQTTLDLRGTNLRGLYALRCKFGGAITNEQTNASQAVFRGCDTSGFAWGQAQRGGMVLRPTGPLSLTYGNECALDGPWSMPFSDSFITSISFNFVASLLASAGSDGRVRLWDMQSRSELAVLKWHDDWINSVAFNSNGTLLASAGHNGTVHLWDVQSRSELALLEGHGGSVKSVVFNTNGTLLASADDDGTVRLWDVQRHSVLAVLRAHEGSVNSVVFNSDGTSLASAGDDGSVRLWDVQSRSLLAKLIGHYGSVSSIVFNATGTLLASAGDDNVVRLWDLQSRSELALLEGHGGSVSSVVFNANGTLLASAGFDNTVRLWDIESHSELAVLEGHSGSVRCVVFDRAGTLLASAGYDGTVRLWAMQRHSQLAVLKGHGSAVNSVILDTPGTLLVNAGDDGTVHLWDIQSHRELATLKGHGHSLQSVALNATGTLLASACNDGTMRLWDVQSRSELAVLKGHGRAVKNVVFNATGTLLASAGIDRTVRLWDVKNRTELALFKGHNSSANSVAFNSASTLLASAGNDRTVRLWDVQSRSALAVLTGHGGSVSSVIFNATGTLLASACDDGTVRLWDVQNHSELAVLMGHGSSVRSVVFNTTGTLLASAGIDNTVRLWDVRNRSELAVLTGHSDQVSSVVFNATGTLLASASGDGTVRLWDLRGLDALTTKTKSANSKSKTKVTNKTNASQYGAPFQIIVPMPFAPFSPSWASFDENGNLLDWDDAAIDHWLHSQRNGRAAPIESVL